MGAEPIKKFLARMSARYILILAALLAVPGAASGVGLRGGTSRKESSRGIFDDLFDKKSDNVDPMDSYIKSSKKLGDSVWWSDSKSKSSDASPTKASAPVKESADVKQLDTPLDTPVFKPFKPSNSMMFAAPEAPVARPFSIGGSNSQGGGAVVDVKLDSELQESQSLLQSRKHGRSATAPNVEDAVASERMQDVYIHDTFGAAAAEDTKKEQEVNASRDLKP